jgi:hypothetical protein
MAAGYLRKMVPLSFDPTRHALPRRKTGTCEDAGAQEVDFGHRRPREFAGAAAIRLPRERKNRWRRRFWATCRSPHCAKLSFRFNVVIGAVFDPADRAVGDRRPLAIECFFSNTRLKTAFGAVQNACSSLPGEPRGLMWACDGGGHPYVVPTGGPGALWEIGANRLRRREDRMTGEQGDLPGYITRGDRTLPRNKWRLR